jgi:hypothetical protein
VVVYSTFFSPDEWLQNADELQPVLGEKADYRVPSNVRQRVREVYRSFVLGNYLASIALSRAILEYALADRGGRLGIQVYSSDPCFPNRVRRLSQLVEDASERLPGLQFAMESIVEAGNKTLHPKKRDNLVLLPHVVRSLAHDSVHAIREVVEVLYLRT